MKLIVNRINRWPSAWTKTCLQSWGKMIRCSRSIGESSIEHIRWRKRSMNNNIYSQLELSHQLMTWLYYRITKTYHSNTLIINPIPRSPCSNLLLQHSSIPSISIKTQANNSSTSSKWHMMLNSTLKSWKGRTRLLNS